MTRTLLLSAALTLAVVAAPAQALDDAQIAAIVVTANQVDIDAGRLAAVKGASESVREFGELMTNDHTGVHQAAAELVERLGVTPEENDTSRSLKAAGESNVAKLESLSGSAFDTAYIEHEVAYHQQVIQALDDALIPNAQNEELKALLVKVRPAFVAHMEHAKNLQAELEAK